LIKEFAMSASTAPSYAGWAVPGYTEERVLGQGLSGRVVAAVSEATGQRVAIKYFDSYLATNEDFLWEYRSLAERLVDLNAPHLVKLLDYFEQPGQGAAVVMELVDGLSLREMIARRGPLSPVAALVVLKDSLFALAAAHGRRVAHCDVKPDNVLINAQGWCSLTDFGIAVKTDLQMPAAGTPAYMAPELWNGAPNVPATDMYSATAVFCESLTGQPPFSGDLGELRQQHESAPVPLDRYDPPLQDLIEWGLAKDPQDRPRSARAFVGEVDARAAAVYGPYWEDEGRRELADRAGALLLAGDGGGPGTPMTRLAQRFPWLPQGKNLTFPLVTAVAVLVALVVAVVALAGKFDKAELSSSTAANFAVQTSVTPPVAQSKCASPTTFTFSGTVNATTAGTVSYRWLYSSGAQGPVQSLHFFVPGGESVTGQAVKTAAAGSGWAEIETLGSGGKTSDKATYRLVCGTGSKDLAASASVTPATQSLSSCTAAAPSLTAAGSVTSKVKGTVSYYWALGNGVTTKAATLSFAKAGTKSVAPYTFTPPGVPSSGDAELVVTKPGVTTSSAPYSVSCSNPKAVATGSAAKAFTSPSGSAPASAPASAKKSASASPSASASATSASPTPTRTKTRRPTPSASASASGSDSASGSASASASASGSDSASGSASASASASASDTDTVAAPVTSTSSPAGPGT
jgi:serine/threonine-protein kinase